MITSVAQNQLQRDTERILRSLRPGPTGHPALVVLVGLPGAGKTHLAAELSSRTGAVVLESDAIRRMLFAERRYSRAENRRLFAGIHSAIDRLLELRSQVIVDATNLTERERLPLYMLAERHGVALIVAHVVAPTELARQRLEQRASEPTQSEADLEVYERMQWRVEEIRRPYLMVDTSENVEPALRALTKEMMQQ